MDDTQILRNRIYIVTDFCAKKGFKIERNQGEWQTAEEYIMEIFNKIFETKMEVIKPFCVKITKEAQEELDALKKKLNAPNIDIIAKTKRQITTGQED